MASIQKLLIRGIRSFDPQQEQVIDFQSPLTLIVGHNGAGKTTIIECLKYVTTGDLPPNSKNGAFVFDPKLANENEVKAQVRIKFLNVNGAELVCTRSLSLTQLQNKVSMKTLESLLLLTIRDTQYSISSKCAEIDKEIPNHLGVSRAILENVVFCHQEESLWPLAEPLVLKKKFDEIFAATRYTKALDNIKSLRKQLAIQLKTDSSVLVKEKENKSRALKLRTELTRTRDEADRLQQRLQVLDGGEIDDLHHQMTDIVDRRREITNIQNKIEQFQLERELIMKNSKGLENTVQVIDLSDSELQLMLQKHIASVNSQGNEKASLEREKIGMNQEAATIQHELSEHHSKRGKYLAEDQAHEKRKSECTTAALEMIKKYKLAGFDILNFSNDQVPRLVARLDQELSSKTFESKQYRSTMKEQENVLRNDLQALKSQISGIEETRKMTQNQIATLQQKISYSRNTSNDLASTKRELEHVNESISLEEAEIQDYQQRLLANERDSDTNAMNRQVQDYENKAQDLRDQMSILNLQGDTRAKLALRKSEKQRKNDQCQRLADGINTEWTNLSAAPFSMDSCEFELEQLVRSKESALKTIQENRVVQSSKLSAIDSKLNMVRQSIQQKSKELEVKNQQLQRVLGSDDYIESKKQAESDFETYQTNLASMRSASSMYSKFIGKFKDTKCCPLCVRGFADTQQEDTFLRKLEQVLARVPNATKAAETECNKAEQKLNQLRDLQTIWDDIDRISTVELVELGQQRDEYETEKSLVVNDFEDGDSEVALLQVEIDQIRGLQQRATECSRLSREVTLADKEIKALEADLTVSGSLKTIEEVQQEYEQIQSECKMIRSKIDRVNNENRVKQQSLLQKQSRLRDLKDEQLKIQFRVKELEKVLSLSTEYQQEIEKLNKQLAESESTSAGLPRQIQVLEQKLAAQQQHVSQREELISKDIQTLSTSLNQLNSLINQLKGYSTDNPAQRLTNCELAIQNCNKSLEDISKSLDLINSKLESLSKKESEIQVYERNIRDNIQIRQFKNDILQINGKIDAYQRTLAASSQSSIDEEYGRLKEKHDSLLGERSQIVGEVKQLEEQVRKLNMQLTTDYNNIDKKYLDLKYKVTSTELGIEDLEKYAISLDKAIMKFHAMKMNEINKIIRELWIKTYRGTDIDTIEIRSDPDGGDASKKSYNYRVVMVRRDVEMDMRGRCSAGQKVLASIIIRLALAETFCLHCGILALDEPTTNLDSENIASLARSLGDIIESRASQRNFQLIVITHDEEFLQALGGSDHADYYYRVTKDRDGCSTITRMAMSGEEVYEMS